MHTRNVDRFRFLIESMPPQDYLGSSYYERWLAYILATSQEQGFLDSDQLQAINAGQVPATEPADAEAAPPEIVSMLIDVCSDGVRDYSGRGRFAEGDRVRAVSRHIPGHTRLPRYVRGHPGVFVKDNGSHLFPDTHARTGEVEMQRLYTVTFKATDLWGGDANPHDSVSLDLWETYLDEV